MTLKEAIGYCEGTDDKHRQLAKLLKLLERAKFEYDEAVRIIDCPTPDVREVDKTRAYAVINTFAFLQELDGEVNRND